MDTNYYDDEDVNGMHRVPTYNLEHDEYPGENAAVTTDLYPEDDTRRTAYYDYASEKTLSHADAKLFYQRHRLEQQSTQEAKTSGEASFKSTIHDDALISSSLSDRFQGSLALASPTSAFASPNSTANEQTSGITQSTITTATAQVSGQERPSDPKNDRQGASISKSGGHSYDTGPPLTTSGPLPGSDMGIASELNAIYSNIQRILDTRHKYIRLSLQDTGDNPKDDPNNAIYPPPPEPVWDEESNRPMTASKDNQLPTKNRSFHHEPRQNDPNSAKGSSFSLAGSVDSPSTSKRKWRKPGHDIGEDFDMEDLLPLPDESEMTFELDEKGVYQVYENQKSMEIERPILDIPTIRDFYMDLDMILSVSSDGPSKSFAFRRLQYLEGRYNLYYLLNEYHETAESKRVPHRDFYNVRKVDTHVHHSACMNQKHLLRFIKSKMKKCPNEIVMFRDGKELSLEQVFESINLTAYDLSIDTLDMHAHTDSFHRFDKFNLKYNPIGESRLRTIFLKTDNHIQGRYLAELTKEVISDLESSKYQMVEWRISIYGRSLDEWDKLAAWVVDNKLFSHNVRWLIQVPRLYDVFRASGLIDNFEQVVKNVFQPLFEVTKDPSSHPKLFIFLQRVIGFDSVDDESKPERRLFRKFPLPKVWDFKQNPPYSYWIYYLFANIASLNAWRKQRGFNTFHLRPHCGEAGETDHLAAAVLCCHSISHGILLRKVPLLQYIFYLEQIGMAMSPLSNNALFLAYERNPFLSYFRRGLNVSLSTDDPLQIAFTKEPLIEEYSVAAQIYKFNAVDMCELAKNSVIQSGFEHSLKQRWLGNDYHLPGVAGNNVAKTNVPNIRVDFRHSTLVQERMLINRFTENPETAQPVSSINLPPGKTKTRGMAEPPSPSMSMKTNFSVSNMQHTATNQTASVMDSIANSMAYGSPLLHAQSLPQRYSFRDLPGPAVDNRTQSSHGGQMPKHSPTTSVKPEKWAEIPTPSHIDGTEPRIFPGVVHERTRRNSLQKNSVSERDLENFYASMRKVVSRDGPTEGANGTS